MYSALLSIQKVFDRYSNPVMSLNLACPTIANAIGADRIVIFKEELASSGKERFLSMYHQWNDKGIDPVDRQKNFLSVVSLKDTFVDYAKTIAVEKPFIFDDETKKSIHDQDMTKFFESQEIKTLIVVPIFVDNVVWGAMSCHYVIKPVKATQELTSKIQVIANCFAASLKSNIAKIENSQDLVESQSARMVELGRMAAGIAHEINNPVFIIGGFSSRMEQILKNSECATRKEDAFSCLEMIQKNCKKITDIIEGLRMMSRDSSKDNFEVVDLNKVISTVFEMSKERFIKEDIEISFDESEHEYLVECKPGQISQVITNLLNNSFDSISSLGKVKKWVKISTLIEEDDVLIRVTDSGQKLSQELIDNIMEPFFTTKSRGNGTGLGLSISREIIKRFGGKLQVNEDCENVMFEIVLPQISFEGDD